MFSISVPLKNYVIHIKSPLYLAANVSADATKGNVSGLRVSLRPGDANNDNSVDSTDFGLLIGAFGSDASIPGSGYDPTCDFQTATALFDSTDFGLLIGEFNNIGDL